MTRDICNGHRIRNPCISTCVGPRRVFKGLLLPPESKRRLVSRPPTRCVSKHVARDRRSPPSVRKTKPRGLSDVCPTRRPRVCSCVPSGLLPYHIRSRHPRTLPGFCPGPDIGCPLLLRIPRNTQTIHPTNRYQVSHSPSASVTPVLRFPGPSLLLSVRWLTTYTVHRFETIRTSSTRTLGQCGVFTQNCHHTRPMVTWVHPNGLFCVLRSNLTLESICYLKKNSEINENSVPE